MSCDTISGWDDMSPEERREALEQDTREMLEDMGLDPDDYTIEWGDVEDGAASYNWDDHTITFDDSVAENPDPIYAEETAAHEARHAQQQDEYEKYGDVEKPWDPYDREEDAQDFADTMVPDFELDCPPPPDSASNNKRDMPRPKGPAGDYNLPSGDTAYA